MKIGKFKKIAAIGLALTMAIGLLYTSGTVNAVEENPTEDNGLELNKTAVFDEASGKYKITLDAYTTGITETIDTSKPTDIVLVLDQSGSMADEIKVGERAYYASLWSNWSPIVASYGSNLYYLDNGVYRPVTVEVGFLGIYYTYSYYDENNIKQEFTVHTVFSSVPEPLKNNLYTLRHTDEKMSRLDALKDAVSNFRKQIELDAVENGVEHRIAIAGFGSLVGYNYNTEILTLEGTNSSFELENETGKVGVRYQNLNGTLYKKALVPYDSEILDSSLAALDAYGATETDYGMEMAKNILDNNPSNGERNQAVVLFTDGSPTRGSVFDDEVATNTIKYAKELKDKGIPVYTVGVYGENETQRDYIDQFMNYTSSNHPYATDYNHGGQKQSDDYYFTASNAGDLVDIFEQISESISKPSVPLTTNTTIKDYMSNYFTIDTSKSYKVEKIACSSYENGSYVFDGEVTDITEQIDNVNGINIIDNKLITVSGYDYNANLVSGDSPNNVQGSMLRITFYAKPIDGFIGGLSVPTNGNNSGLYLNGTDSTAFENFEMPYVDVDLNYDYDVTDQGMYIGNDWKDVEKFLNLDSNSLPQYKIEDIPYSLHDSYVNDYVDVVYTIKHGNDTVGTYTVNAGSKQGILDLKDSFDATSFTGTEGFAVTVNVTNKAGQNASATDKYEQKDNVAKNAKNANLYVFVPTLNTDDTEIFLGESTDLDDRISVEDNWNCTDSSLTGDKLNTIKKTLTETDKPTLTYTYSPNDNVDIDGNYKPAIKGEHKFEVNVFNGKVNITKFSKFKHAHSDNPNCTENHFFVVVKDGSITINKTISNDHLIDESKGNPIFTYKIEKKLDNGEYKLVAYKYISMKKLNDGEWEQISGINLSGLEKGTYRISELSNLRYEQVSVQVDKKAYSNPILEVTIDSENSSHTIDYTNKVKSTSYDSDSSVLINKFVLGEDGHVKIQQDRLDK